MPEETKEKKPSWVKLKPTELEKLVVDLAKEGNSPAKIGLILRDEHGVPRAKLLGKKISQILKENNIEIESEKSQVEKKLDKLKTHLENNKHDYDSQRALTKKLWVVHKLERKQKPAR